MIVPYTYRGRTVAVFGLGRTGVSSALALARAGARVLAWDDRAETRDAARAKGVRIADLLKADWSRIDTLLLSPGVPHHLPEPHWTAARAREAGVPIICDVEVFAAEMAGRTPRPRIVAITGTNGKSTTTALTAHVLNTAGYDVHMGGNIGRGVLDLPEPGADTVYVLELSSYQLERAPSLHADVAMFLNLSPDHLDRHGDMAGYEAAKRNIFRNQTAEDTAVVGTDDAAGKRIVSQMKRRSRARLVPVSARAILDDGVYVVGGKLTDGTGSKARTVADLALAPHLQGRHNQQNAAFAYSAARALGVSARRIADGLLSFPGLAHRMEIVGRAGPVVFVNDSKATNADAARQALSTYHNIYWIAGGLPKSGGIDGLSDLFGRVACAYLIGVAAPAFARTSKAEGLSHRHSKTLDAALRSASRDAFKAGQPAVILLSPACASFDQFASYEARGDAFRAQARDIVDIYESETSKRA